MSKQLSIIDALAALKDVDDEMPINDSSVEVNPSRRRPRYMTEGKAFSVMNDNDMQAAQKFNEEESSKDLDLEVIDVDADSLEHIKKGEEYVGQMLIQCNACKATRFIKPDDLEQSDADSDVYNKQTECPHCHTKSGYALLGQVGKIDSEENTDDVINTDSLTDDEFKFENDFEADEAEEEIEAAEAEAPAEQPGEEDEEVSIDDLDTSVFDETDAEDDTVDMKDTTGDIIDADDIEWDDTEDKPVEEDLDKNLDEDVDTLDTTEPEEELVEGGINNHE